MTVLRFVALAWVLPLAGVLGSTGCSSSTSPGDGSRDAAVPDGDDGGGTERDAGPRPDGGGHAEDGGSRAEDGGPGLDGGPVVADGGVDGGACPEPGCDDETVMGFDLPACCPTGGSGCGYDLTSVASLVGLDASEVSCVATDQPGDRDSSCPSRTVLSIFTLPGCCLPSGDCGYLVELTSVGFPDVGCVSYDLFSGAGTPGSCTP